MRYQIYPLSKWTKQKAKVYKNKVPENSKKLWKEGEDIVDKKSLFDKLRKWTINAFNKHHKLGVC